MVVDQFVVLTILVAIFSAKMTVIIRLGLVIFSFALIVLRQSNLAAS